MLVRFSTLSPFGAALAASVLLATAGCSSSSGGASTPGGSSGSSSGGASDTDASSSGGPSSSGGSSGAGSSGVPGSSGSSGAGGSSGTSSGGLSAGGFSSGSPGGEGGTASFDAGAYPAGPYCANAGSGGALPVGCVVPNMTWIGYDDSAADALATTKPYATYTLDDARRSGKRWAMINVAEFDCPGCMNSADLLGSGAAAVVQAGGVVIEVLMTSGFTTQAAKADLQYWVTNHSLHNTTVKDPDAANTMCSAGACPSNDLFGRRDQAYIVDLTTMKIAYFEPGSIVNAGTANSAAQGLAQMHTLLGK